MGYLTIPAGTFSPDQLGVLTLFTNNSASTGLPGTDPSDGGAREYQWVPFATTVKSLHIHTSAAPGVGKTENYRIHDDSDGDVSTIQQIVGAVSQDVSNVIEEDLPGLDVSSDTTIRDTISYITAWPSTTLNAGGNGFLAMEYLTAGHPEYIWFIVSIGADIAVASFSGTDQFSSLCDPGISTAFTVQQNRQIRMPIRGQLKYAFAAWRGYTNTTTVEACIQKGTIGAGIDTALLIAMQGAGTTTPYQAFIDTNTEVAVAEGDYLNWRITRTAGAATTGAICLGVGFAPGL